MSDRNLVVVSLLTARQEFQRQQEQDARAAAGRSGLRVEVVFAENDPATQIQQLEAFIRLPPEPRPVAFVIETVAAVGFEKIARGRAHRPDRLGGGLLPRALPRDPAQGVPGRARHLRHHRRAWRSAASRGGSFLALLPAGGNVLYVEGPSMSAATIFRRRMAEQELKGSAVSIVHVVSGDWTAAGAEWAVSSWLGLDESREARFDLVGGQNDEMALGARAALAAPASRLVGPHHRLRRARERRPALRARGPARRHRGEAHHRRPGGGAGGQVPPRRAGASAPGAPAGRRSLRSRICKKR